MIKEECQKEVDYAMPACEAALKALASLDRESLQQISNSTNPPEMMKLTMEAVCIMLGAEPGDECYQEKRLSVRERVRERERDTEREREREKQRERDRDRETNRWRKTQKRERDRGR